MAEKKKPVETRNCEYCDKEFRIGKGFGGYRRRFCDQKCSIAFRSSRKYHAPGLKEGYDYIKCPICEQRMYEISFQHAKNHGFNDQTKLANYYGMPSAKCQKASEKMSGVKNPGWQHGGRMSPVSFKNPNLTQKQVLSNRKKLKKASKGTRPNELQHWLDRGYTEEEGRAIISNIQSKFSKKSCIEKYGQELGLEEWVNRNYKWLVSRTTLPYSKISQELFWEVYGQLANKEHIMFATLGPDGVRSMMAPITNID